MSTFKVGFTYVPPNEAAYTVMLNIMPSMCSDVANAHRRNDAWFIWDGLWMTVRDLMLAGF